MTSTLLEPSVRSPLRSSTPRASRSLRVGVVLGSVALALWGGELVLAWSQHAAGRQALARRAGVRYDRRTPSQVVLDLRARGLDAVPAINRPWSTAFTAPTPDAVFPLGGVPNRLTVLCNESGSYASYRSDPHGFNNPPELWDGRPIDVVLLGDSFVQGSCVGPDQTIAAGVRRVVPRTLNLGYGGNGPLGLLATLMEYAQPIRPARVIWSFYEGNDLDDLQQELAYPYLRTMAVLTANGRQDLLHRQDQIARDYVPWVTREAMEQALARTHPHTQGWWTYDALCARFGEDSPWLFAAQWAKLSTLRTMGRTVLASLTAGRKPVFPNEEVFRRVLLAARDATTSWGGQLYMLYLPEWQRYRPFGRPNPARDEVLRIAAQLGIPIIDIDPAFRASGHPRRYFPFGLPGHYNADGYRLVAQRILAALGASEDRPGPAASSAL